MKKISMMAVLSAMTITSAFAAPMNNGTMNNGTMNNANNNNMMTVMTVEQVRSQNDNTPVIMRGYLIRQNGENSYVFQDSTGTINLEIDAEDWNGLTVSPTDFVEIWGEVDRNGVSMMEVDVSTIKKI